MTDSTGSFDQGAVKDAALPVLERWNRDRTIDDVRTRLQWLAFAFGFVAILGLVYEPPGITGFLLQVWSLASIPIAAVSGALYATVRNPRKATEVWWESGLLLTVGLIALAVLSQSGKRSALGRAAWQLLFGDESPTGVAYQFGPDGDDVDLARVAELRHWVRNLVAASIVVVAIDTGFRVYGDEITAVVVAVMSGEAPAGGGGNPLPSVPFLAPSSPVEYVLLVVVTAVVGVVIGFFVAVRREL